MTAVGTAVGIAVFAALGAVARNRLSAVLARDRLPLGTLVANLSASFLTGLLAGSDHTPDVLLTVGLLGTLSTWSSLAVEIVDQLGHGQRALAATYAAGSVLGGVGLAWLGLNATS